MQPDHVHVVVHAPGVTGKRVTRDLKAWASRVLNGLGARRRHWWTAGGKVEPVWNDQRLRQAVVYVRDQPFPKVE